MHQNDPLPQKLVFACVGSNGSGKDTVIDYILSNYHALRISISDMVRAKATELSLTHTRENLNHVSKNLIQRYGNDYFAKLAIAQISKSECHHIAIPDIRSPQDVRTFREAFGDKFVLIAVVVNDAKIRFERLLARGTQRDPKSWEEFLRNERREEEIFRISTTVLLADYALYNDQSLSKLRENVDLVAVKLGLRKK